MSVVLSKKNMLSPVMSNTLMYQRVREIEGHLMTNIDDFYQENYPDNSLGEAWWEFLLWPEDEVPQPGDLLESEYMFSVWHYFHWRPEAEPALKTHQDVPNHLTPAAYYQVGRLLNPLETQFIEAASNSHWGFYLVVNVSPGESLTLKNLFTDKIITVVERQASKLELEGAMLYTTVLNFDHFSMMFGCAPYIFNHVQALEILEFRDNMAASGVVWTDERIREHEAEMFEFYWNFREELLNPAPPIMTNTDGDHIEFHTLVYRLECSVDEAFHAMKSLAIGMKELELYEHGRFDDEGQLLAIDMPWLKRGKKQQIEKSLMGTVNIQAGRMLVELNSRERAVSMKRRVAQRLRKCAKLLIDKIQSLDSMLEDEFVPSSEFQFDQFRIKSKYSASETLRKQMDWQHWQTWIHTSIPALDGLTPKQAMGTPNERRKLEVLIAGFRFDYPEHRHWVVEELALEDF